MKLKNIKLFIKYSNCKHAATDFFLIGKPFDWNFSYLLVFSFDLLAYLRDEIRLSLNLINFLLLIVF